MQGGWNGHALLGRIAFESLPAWERALIQPDMSPAALAKPYMDETVRTVADLVGIWCNIMDLVYYDDCRPYATLPDGRWIPHSPPDEHMQASVASGRAPCPLAFVRLVELLLTRMIDAVRGGDWNEVVRHGGVLGHFLQEPFSPGHAVNNTLFHELFPDPDPERHIRVHHAFDIASGDFVPLPPRLLGTSVTEAALRLKITIDQGVRAGKQLIGPILELLYAGHPVAARQRLMTAQSQQAAWATACAWHTVLCIALDQVDQDAVAALQTLPLTELTPYFFHHWQYVEMLPGHLVRDGRKIQIHVWNQENAGERTDTRVEDGFGMGGYMGIKFFVDGDVFPRFRCRVGLASRHTEGQDAHTDTRFYVEMDRDLNTVYSEEIEYGAETLATVQLVSGAAPRQIEVPLTGARSLILRAKSEPWTDPDTGQRCFSIPHIAVCEPVLMK